MTTTKLDANQVLKGAYDEPNKRLRVDATLSGDVIVDEINISQVDDSIRLGDGVDLITATIDGAKVGLDVNVLNDIQLDIDAAAGDNIAISDGVDTLAIESDGSINVNISGLKLPLVENESIILANTEYNITIPLATKKFYFRNRGSGKLQISFISGQSDTIYFTLSPGVTYSEEQLILDADIELYVRSSKANEIIEILRWE